MSRTAAGCREYYERTHPGAKPYRPRGFKTVRRTQEQIRRDRVEDFLIMLDEQRSRVMDFLLATEETKRIRRMEEEPYMHSEAELVEVRR
jgi:hypothetical protein